MPRPFGGVREQAEWWQAYYPGPDGRRVHETTHFESYDDARAWLDDVARERNRGGWHDPAAAHQRLDTFAMAWITSRRGSGHCAHLAQDSSPAGSTGPPS